MDEQGAIEQIKKGNIDGLEVLVRKYQVRAVRAAFLVAQDRYLAEDVVQTAFIRVYERIGQFDSDRPFWPWFARIVVNDAVKAVRRSQRWFSLNGNKENISLEEIIPDDGLSPSEQLEMSELRETVRKAIETLPPAQRAVIVLNYFVGMSEVEMAEEMKAPAGTVKWRLHAARKKLHRMLESERRNDE